MSKPQSHKIMWKEGQLSYKDHITHPSEVREDLYCLTLAQTEALIAVIENYRWLTRWLDDDEAQLPFTDVEQFVNDTQRRLMMPCGDDNIIIMFRWDADGNLEESKDGGLTYTPSPQKDPRRNSTIFPVPTGDQNDKCVAADSAVNSIIVDVFNEMTDAMTLGSLDELIRAWVSRYIQTANVLQALFAVAINIIFAIGSTAIIAALTTGVWNTLRCCFFNHMEDDLSFTNDGWLGLRDCITSDISGIAGIFLEHLIFLAGPVGCTNIMRAGIGSADASCCGECDFDLWDFFDVDAGTTVTKSSSAWTIDSDVRGDGKYYVIILSDDDNTCCQVVLGAETLWDQAFYIPCGTARAGITTGTGRLTLSGTPSESANAILLVNNTATFTVPVTRYP
jgi:hypothetical protein